MQLGLGDVKPSKVNKPMKGYFEKQDVAPRRWLREFRVDSTADYQVGQEITVSLFQNGEVVDVIGVSKGKGTAGVIEAPRLRRYAGEPWSLGHTPSPRFNRMQQLSRPRNEGPENGGSHGQRASHNEEP